MGQVLIGALLMISGMVWMALRTLRRGGKLSEPTPRPAEANPPTLEPKGRGRRLSFKADLPGLALIVVGLGLLLATAA